MDSDTKLSRSRHVQDARAKLISEPELPFQQVLSSKKIIASIMAQEIEYRDRIYTPDLTLWTFLSQVLNDDKSCQAAVTRLIAFLATKGQALPSANTAAYSKARTRLPGELISELTRQCGKDLEDQSPETWLWRGRHVNLIDGTTLSMPDTAKNQAHYTQSPKQKIGVGFPIARLVAIISCTTGAVQDVAISGYSGKGTSEFALLRQMMRHFKPGQIVLADRMYCSFFLVAWLMSLKVDIVFPMHGSRFSDFRKGKRLGKKDYLMKWTKPQLKPFWMDVETYNSFPKEIQIREVVTRVETKGCRSNARILVTTFLDPKEMNEDDLVKLYAHRWFVETDLRAIKQTMKMDILRGQTPKMVEKEIWMHLLAYNMIRKIMAQAAQTYKTIPRALSFRLSMQTVEAFRASDLFDQENLYIYQQMLKVIAYKAVGNRPGRSEPRRIKRRPKQFLRLQKPRHLYQKKAA